MALKVKSCVIQNGCEGFYFFEKTGAYDAVNNTTGYGAPNPDFADATAAVINVYISGATVPISLDVFSTLPTDDTNSYYNVTLSALGLTAMPAGLTRIVYLVTVGGTTYQSTSLVLFDCEYDCCVDKKIRDAVDSYVSGGCGCGCENEAMLNALFLDAVLEGARAATCCGDINSVETNMSFLKLKCSSSGCNDC